MDIFVTIKPGVSPMDRGYIEDLITSRLESDLGGAAECTGGGTLMGEGAYAESDFDIAYDGSDAQGAAAICREVLGGIPFTMTTTMTVRVDPIPEFQVVVENDEPE